MDTYKGLDVYRLYDENHLSILKKNFLSSFIVLEKDLIENNKIKMLAQHKLFGNKYYVEYLVITNEEIGERINNNQSLNLYGRYIDGFDIKRMSLRKDYFIKKFSTRYSYFCNGANFKNAKFVEEYVDISNTIFEEGNVNFSFSRFGNSIINFSFSQFGEGYVDFSFGEFDDGRVYFRNVHFGNGDIRFLGTKFGNSVVKFAGCESYGNLVFKNTVLKNDIEISFKKVKSLTIRNCKVKSLLQISGVEEGLCFNDTVNMGRIEMDCEENDVVKCLMNRYIPKKTWYQKINIFRKSTKEEIDNYKAIAKDLKMLKENYRNIGEYEWEDECYRAYMKYHTKSLKWLPKVGFIKKPFNRLFGLISGYGTKVLNILVTCVVVILIYAGVYKSAFNSADFPFLKSLYFSAITFLTIGYGDLSPTNGSFKYFQVASTGIEGFIGLVLMSLVTVTIVRKILR